MSAETTCENCGHQHMTRRFCNPNCECDDYQPHEDFAPEVSDYWDDRWALEHATWPTTFEMRDDGLGLFCGLLTVGCLYLVVGCGIMATLEGWPWTIGFLLGIIGIGRIWILDAR